MPLTTATPAPAAYAAMPRHASAPYAVWSRLPTIATAGRSSSSRRPRANRTGGGSGMWRSDGGERRIGGHQHGAACRFGRGARPARRPRETARGDCGGERRPHTGNRAERGAAAPRAPASAEPNAARSASRRAAPTPGVRARATQAARPASIRPPPLLGRPGRLDQAPQELLEIVQSGTRDAGDGQHPGGVGGAERRHGRRRRRADPAW